MTKGMTKEMNNMKQSPDAPDRARRMILKGAAVCGVAGLGLADLPLLLNPGDLLVFNDIC